MRAMSIVEISHLSLRSRRSTCCPLPWAVWTGWPGAARSVSGPSLVPIGSSCSRPALSGLPRKENTPIQSVVDRNKFLINDHNRWDENRRVGYENTRNRNPLSAHRSPNADEATSPDWATLLTSCDASFLWSSIFFFYFTEKFINFLLITGLESCSTWTQRHVYCSEFYYLSKRKKCTTKLHL